MIGQSKSLFAFAVGVLDPSSGDFPFLYVNERMVQLTGYHDHAIVGRSFQTIFGTKTDSDTRLHVRIGLQNGRYTEADLLCYRPSGAVFWNRMTFTPICDHEGRLCLFLVSGQDISRVRRLEDGLLNPEKLTDRTIRSMQIVIDKTEARFHAVRQFQAVIVSHLERSWRRKVNRIPTQGTTIVAEEFDKLEKITGRRQGALMGSGVGSPIRPQRMVGSPSNA